MNKAKELQELTTTNQVMRYSLNGYHVSEIAEALGVTENTVRRHLAEATAQASVEFKEYSEQILAKAAARTEIIVSRLMREIETEEKVDLPTVDRLAKLFMLQAQMAKQANPIVNRDEDDNGHGGKRMQERTISFDSPSYRRALELAQNDPDFLPNLTNTERMTQMVDSMQKEMSNDPSDD